MKSVENQLYEVFQCMRSIRSHHLNTQRLDLAQEVLEQSYWRKDCEWRYFLDHFSLCSSSHRLMPREKHNDVLGTK